MLLELAHIVDGGCANDMVAIVLNALVNVARQTRKGISKKFISIGSDGTSVF